MLSIYCLENMYRIRIDKTRLDVLTRQYLTKYKDGLRKEIMGFLNGGVSFELSHTTSEKTPRKFTLKVNNTKNSFTTAFLEECADPQKMLLDDLLVGDVGAQLRIIQRVKSDSLENFNKLTGGKANRLHYNDGDELDDFNALMHEIFVKRSFEGDKAAVYAKPLDKDEFVKNLEIRICPYCGRAYIYRVVKKGKNGDVSVKPQLDHFLPKSNYPFLAMNYFNLIPCCTQCNLAPCKVDNDPLDGSRQQVTYLMHPYDFDETMVRFIYEMKAPDTYKPESFDVLVGYQSKVHKIGYNRFFALDKLYAGHKVEVCNMFWRRRALQAAFNGFYKGIGIQVPAHVMAQGILGFNLNGLEERRQLMYKFKKDTFLQMMGSSSKAAVNYYADRNEKEIIVKI